MLLVHAHPDDETINNGATIAAAAASGVVVTLVTCTRGELGEVLPADLAHLKGDPDALGAYREGELAAAMVRLGVTDHRFLGADPARPPVRYRDSGMVTLPSGQAGTPADLDPRAFAAADLDEAAAHLCAVIEEIRPQVVLTYDAGGGYGHPDHVMAHRVAMRALDLAEWSVAKVYASAIPRSLVQAYIEAMGEAAGGFGANGEFPSMVMADEDVTTAIQAEPAREAKLAALECHRSQLVVDRATGTATQDDGFAQPVLGTEWYSLLRGTPAAPFDADGRERDLFSGTD